MWVEVALRAESGRTGSRRENNRGRCDEGDYDAELAQHLILLSSYFRPTGPVTLRSHAGHGQLHVATAVFAGILRRLLIFDFVIDDALQVGPLHRSHHSAAVDEQWWAWS